jgi:hypothetical protein
MSSLSGISLFAQNSGYFSMVGQRHEETNPSLGEPYIFLTLVIQSMNREVTVSFPCELNARVQRDFGNRFQAKLINSLFRKYIWGILSTEAFQERLRGLYALSNDTAPELAVGHLLGDSTSRKKILLEDILEKIPTLRTTWFHQACKSGDRALVRLMLEFLSALNQNHVDIRNEDGCTALMVAIEHDRYEVAELLLAAKADPNACDAKGRLKVKSDWV